MMSVPSLYEKNPRTHKLDDGPVSVPPAVIHEWTAMESIPGADVRVTVRLHEPVRVEVAQRPNEDQRARGITNPWYRDCQRIQADYWLWLAAEQTDLSNVPDGEWEGQAIGESINRNSMDIEGHRIVFSSLFPWRDVITGVDIPPALGRIPMGFEDLRFWLATTPSAYPHSRREGIPTDGVVWWLHEQPVAQVRAREFPQVTHAPNPEAELPPVFEEEPFVYPGDA